MQKRKADILVIGSGMGGMTAAAILAKNGYKVFVAEKMSRIGGRCSTLEYKGYKCTSGVLAVEMNGVVQDIFKRVEADFDVIPTGAPQYLIKGTPFDVPHKAGMKALLEATGADQGSVEKVMAAMSKAINWKEPSPGINLHDWIRQYTKHAGIMNVFRTMVKAALMVTTKSVTAQYFFKYIKTLKGENRFGYCGGGSAVLPEALGLIVLRHGGDIWTESRVTRVLTADGMVQGAVLNRQGKEFQIDSQVVISDTGPKNTVELTGKQYFDPDYLREMEKKLSPTAAICLQFGLEEPLFDKNHLLLTNTKRIYAVYQPTVLCPALAPTGKHLLVANAIPASVDTLSSEKGRQKEMDLCFEDLETVFPRIKKSATVLLTGIYRVFWPGMHAWPGQDMPIKTPVINLYNVGDGVKQIGYAGLPAVVQTGVLVAEEISQRITLYNGVTQGATPA